MADLINPKRRGNKTQLSRREKDIWVALAKRMTKLETLNLLEEEVWGVIIPRTEKNPMLDNMNGHYIQS